MECRRTSVKTVVKRCRTRFKLCQIQRLEQVFQKTHYPDAKQMEKLSIDTKIPGPKMQIWFQNRRAKWRKNSRLKNFGGLADVKETEFVPAPNVSDTLISFQFGNIFPDYIREFQINENNAIDLRKPTQSDSELLPKSMPTVPEIYDKSSVYKKSGGLTSDRLNDHMNAFEYPTSYYSRHCIDNKRDIPSLESFAFASNQNKTSLLFAPTTPIQQTHTFLR